VVLLLEIAGILATAIAHSVDNTAFAALEDQPRSRDVIFFSADELPHTQDLGGAPKGSEGKSGGASIHHDVQTIKVARGASLHERVVDAPEVNLPKSDAAIKNLLAYKTDVAPPPVEQLRLEKRSAQLQAVVTPPPPELRNEFRRPQLTQQQVAPPPVELPAQSLSARRNLSAANSVAPPPVSAPDQALSRSPRLTLPAASVVAPRPEMTVPMRSRGDVPGVAETVVPPPAELNAVRSQSLDRLSGNQTVAPPPVEVGSRLQTRVSLHGSAAVGAPPESASTKASGPTAANQTTTSGVIASPKPGDKAAQSQDPERAMLAMSPAGASTGVGSSGGGLGAARGSGAGSSSTGSGPGGSFSGAGKGSDATPRNGTSSDAGPGGAGDRYRGRVPGVSVTGGSNVLTLPSFGGAEPSSGGRSDIHKNNNGVTVVASPRAGGAMNYYGALKGDRVYTIYFKTAAGMVSLQFADPQSAVHPYTEDLIAPQALSTAISSDVPRARLVMKCVIDRDGVLKNVSVLQSAGGEFERQVIGALPGWKFSPAYRGSDPVEVTAILGFGIDTK